MASTATKQTPPSFVGTSKVVETSYPVCNWRSVGCAATRMNDSTDWDILAHRQRPVRFPSLISRDDFLWWCPRRLGNLGKC
ncbi:hypothetical protein M440DRAFT_1105914 [Trichoderma longibrachiatum ATCC 18648]|uniref:Uncharacterized protein n=1 Tax=Trichoderma longibrachiatum ATCC 18648 TaxID=983965 RepID=A0A2T4CEC0_TRILO|nr:hypothetical protein M440DRAFT_1105914 [Trichoderma longibrachiatum ATCC 18648]